MSESMSGSSSARRYKAYVGPLGTTQLHLINPFVVAWWSAAFPGFGHILLSKYFRGYLLIAWEVIVNLGSNLNLAIVYSFTGRFKMAKEALNTEWMLLYVPLYLFAVWDSYRTAVDINRNYTLAAREDAEIKYSEISSVEINYLDKRSPWAALIWSALAPGSGQLYAHRLPSSFFIIIWWITIVYFSKLLPAVHYTFTGEFGRAVNVLNLQWVLNVPSLLFFSIYDAYTETVENNKLFDWEQSKFLNKNYQNALFRMPSSKRNNRGESMYIISVFDHSINLESAITVIQMKGISKEDILAVPMDKKDGDMQLFDTIHNSDSLSLLDLPMILATIFMILGGIYGFVLKWGPIIWGLIGMGLGLCLGLLIKIGMAKKNLNISSNKKVPEVVLIIECKKDQSEMVKDILWAHKALGVRKLILGEGVQ